MDTFRATLLVPHDSGCNLREVRSALQAWDWRRLEDAPPGKHRPDRIEQDGEESELRIYFGDGCIRVGPAQVGPQGVRVIIETDPQREYHLPPREDFPNLDAYHEHIQSLPFQDVFFESCMIALLTRFPGAVAFNHFDESGDVGSNGDWWRLWSSRDPNAPAPLPSHVAGWLVRPRITDKDTYFEAAVRCPCGSERVEVHYPGETHQPGGREDPVPCTVKLPDLVGYQSYWLGLKAVCLACRQECVLFDSKRHGWDAFVPGSDARKRDTALPRPPLVLWPCLGCGSTGHQVELHLRLLAPDRFLSDTFEDTGWPLPLQQRADAFTWLGVSIRCCGCGRRTEDWVGYEAR